MIRFSCPTCDKKLGVDDSRAGTVGKCPGCGGKITIPAAPKVRASGGPELADDEAVQAMRPAPKPGSVRPAALEPDEDDVPVARRKPERDSITREPEARPRPRLTGEEEVEVDDRPRKKRKKKKRQRDAGVGVTVGLIIAGLVAGLLWIVLTPLAFFFKPVAIVMLILGAILGILGRGSFLRIAREEGGSTHLLVMFVPFYEVYFFFSRINRTLVPFLIWACGLFFLFSAGITLWIHHARPEFEADHDAPALAASTPQEVDAQCARLLAGPTKEARTWLREQAAGGKAGEVALATGLVEQAYQAGAKEVIAANPHRDEDGDPVATFIIVLPNDPDARRRIFAWHRGEHGPDDEKDVGQKYLTFEPY
jgi:hypothetical protein